MGDSWPSLVVASQSPLSLCVPSEVRVDAVVKEMLLTSMIDGNHLEDIHVAHSDFSTECVGPQV